MNPITKRLAAPRIQVTKAKVLENHLYKVVLSKLNKYKQIDGKYNRIIRIINFKMLQICYLLIKSNPDNITPGTKDVILLIIA